MLKELARRLFKKVEVDVFGLWLQRSGCKNKQQIKID